MPYSFRRASLGLLAAACFDSGCLRILSAQESIVYSSLSGRVSDPGHASIEHARVAVRDTDTNATATTLTGRDGGFRLPYLRAGRYELVISHEGFAGFSQVLALSAGSAYELPVTLTIAPAGSQITVTGDTLALEAARSQIASTLLQVELQELPLNGRNYLDAALFVPGVSPTNTAANQLFAETSAVPGQGLSISSQRNFSNSYVIDGLSANDDAAGVAGTVLGLDAVQELQVVTSGGQAEFGRALGGYINVLTRSGGNVFHGDLYSYLRNSRFNAANSLSHTVLPLTQTQSGSSFSGPAIHDRTFYFANFEYRGLNQSGLATISPANVAAINARLMATGYPGAAVSTGQFPNPVHNEDFFSKLDHRISAGDQFSARYTLYHVSSINSRGAGGLSAPSASAGLFDTDQTIAANNIWTISPRMVNETHAQFTNSDLFAPPSDPLGPAVSISGVASFGTLSASPTGRLNRMTELADSVAIQSGAHSLRLGANFLYNADTIAFPRTVRGSYSFSSLANFLAGTYNNAGFAQSFGVTRVRQVNPNLGVYAQDEWKAGRGLTLNIGLRFDLEFLRTIATSRNISPRTGFAWTPARLPRTVVRGSYGLFYDRIPLRPLANALLSASNTTAVANLQQMNLSLSPAQTGAPVFPATLASLSLPPGVLFNFTTMDRRISSAYSQQGSLEVEQELGAYASIAVGYEHLRGLHLIASVNQNVPTCLAAGTNNGCRPDPNLGNVSQYSSAGDSHYDGLHISFAQRPVAWGNYRATYTYSKALDDVGEFFFSSPVNNYNIWQDYGRSDDDQRHRFALEGSIHFPLAITLTSSITAYSALPFNVTTGTNTVQGTAARPTVDGSPLTRNAGQSFEQFDWNARLSRTFSWGESWRLTALAEMFNASNHVNAVSVNGVFGVGAYLSSPAPAFRQITAVGDPRSAQFALRFAF